MHFTLSSVVVLLLAVSSKASVISLVHGGLVLPSLAYTAQTVDLGGGLQGAVVAGQPARLVVGHNVVYGGSWIGSPSVVLANPAPVAVKLQTDAEPAAVEGEDDVEDVEAVESVETVPVAPAVVTVVSGEANYLAQTRGAVHSAPLAGHSQSVTANNLEPAPGTV